jgi:Tfp pilus assembly protein PilZ
VARETMPGVGQKVHCRFGVPGSVREVKVEGVVAWTSPVQQHPIHSLPPGFGVSFTDVAEDVQDVIEDIVREHLARRQRGR